MLIDKDCGIHLEIVDSTNTYCKKKEVPTGYFVLAKEQTAGRGRNSRKWISQGEEKFFFSAKFSLPNIHFSIPLLSLFIGSAVLKTLLKHFPDLQTDLKLKWPNDIYLKNKKVSVAVTAVYGGTSISMQIRDLKRGTHIVMKSNLYYRIQNLPKKS